MTCAICVDVCISVNNTKEKLTSQMTQHFKKKIGPSYFYKFHSQLSLSTHGLFWHRLYDSSINKELCEKKQPAELLQWCANCACKPGHHNPDLNIVHISHGEGGERAWAVPEIWGAMFVR